MAQVPGRRLPRLSFSSLERKSRPQLHPAPVFRPANILQIFAGPEKTHSRSERGSAIAEGAKAVAYRAHPAPDGRASFRAVAREKRVRCANLDAVARRRCPRIILQQRPAPE